MQSTVRKRLEQIVQVVFAGNEKAAAEAVGVQQSTLHRILRGKIRDPKLSTLKRLADGFGVPLAWFEGENVPLPEEQGRTLPLWMRLLLAYQRRRNRGAMEWLNALKPKSREAADILAAMRIMMTDKNPYGVALAACITPSIRRRLGLGEEAIPAARTLIEGEAQLAALAVAQLKRLGERAGDSGE